MKVSEGKLARSYNQEDIQQILQIAIARQADDTEFSHEQLVEIAQELEITPECLQIAEKEWSSQQSSIRQRQDFNLYRRSRLQKRFGNYAIANSFFVLLNLANAGELTWSIYILLFWGLGVGLDAWNTFQSQGDDYERAFQKWYRQNQLKQSVSTFVDKIDKWLKA
ncbi:2TM domain-containing protein [Aliterella atlantica]|uniref:2TM domain-containing protein n=1 Tax=Aliterella atlantica CENA595 TaxID=1618023 RepID=A0A0D8ZRJ5_9CYAN|nr:2TM domain-containing protein [Aliterella atlantica]KJH70972.1 hypothetical protein UH38_15415 [Aliterella atlantica CENA595]